VMCGRADPGDAVFLAASIGIRVTLWLRPGPCPSKPAAAASRNRNVIGGGVAGRQTAVPPAWLSMRDPAGGDSAEAMLYILSSPLSRHRASPLFDPSSLRHLLSSLLPLFSHSRPSFVVISSPFAIPYSYYMRR
jgi:hypothetical protein